MHRVIRGAGALLALALVAAACSGNDPKPQAAPATSVSSTTVAPSTGEASSTTAVGAQAASSAQFRAARVRLVRVARLEQPVAMAVRSG